jgi:hypothetical protein
MSIQEPRRIDRHTAEHLLGERAADVRHDYLPLVALLTAVAVPGRPHELASEQASVAAFRTACLSPAPLPGRLTMIKTAVMKVLTVKALVAVLVTGTAGGVALAASNGTLPNPLKESGTASSGLSAAHPSASKSHNPGDDAKASKDPKASKGPDASKAPSPSLVGLCHAYSAGNKDEHGKALENPAFTVLITTAGGKDKVDSFCQALLASAAQDKGNAQSSAKPDNPHPTGAPAEHPTAKPSANPRR